MNVVRTDIDGVVIVEPRLFNDERGYFFESFVEREFREKVADVGFVQDNESFSRRGVVRGLHYQTEPVAQGKLVRCIAGEIFDVAVDVRENSPTFGHWVGVVLSAENHRQLYIPQGFAHGFAARRDSIVQYKCTAVYSPENERTIYAFDPRFGIDWGIVESEAIMSEKDRLLNSKF